MHEQYVTLATLAVVAVVLGGLILILNRILGPQKWTKSKLDTFETGNEPEGDARHRFSIRFYLVAILFILFDIEAVFLYPWAVSFHQLGLYGLIEMVLFIVILLAGYFYLLKKRALEWD